MITRWLKHEGGWRSLTANERPPWEDSTSRRWLDERQAHRWWQNELALIAAPCFEIHGRRGEATRGKTLFTLYSVVDRMHRPQ